MLRKVKNEDEGEPNFRWLAPSSENVRINRPPQCHHQTTFLAMDVDAQLATPHLGDAVQRSAPSLRAARCARCLYTHAIYSVTQLD